ncbi:hypothetical protein FUAX_54390 (plasmid) [Fulvitalea axinellae]|uniref:Uncharacterized protein n=1 Tax=Fulvitalea axinellae TaxID=1182444 RepID=A0AAU9D1I6_9BACT|nr:hypothetical protein FUAX_54390 [Fulvitalea axinellae]
MFAVSIRGKSLWVARFLEARDLRVNLCLYFNYNKCFLLCFGRTDVYSPVSLHDHSGVSQGMPWLYVYDRSVGVSGQLFFCDTGGGESFRYFRFFAVSPFGVRRVGAGFFGGYNLDL